MSLLNVDEKSFVYWFNSSIDSPITWVSYSVGTVIRGLTSPFTFTNSSLNLFNNSACLTPSLLFISSNNIAKLLTPISYNDSHFLIKAWKSSSPSSPSNLISIPGEIAKTKSTLFSFEVSISSFILSISLSGYSSLQFSLWYGSSFGA